MLNIQGQRLLFVDCRSKTGKDKDFTPTGLRLQSASLELILFFLFRWNPKFAA